MDNDDQKIFEMIKASGASLSRKEIRYLLGLIGNDKIPYNPTEVRELLEILQDKKIHKNIQGRYDAARERLIELRKDTLPEKWEEKGPILEKMSKWLSEDVIYRRLQFLKREKYIEEDFSRGYTAWRVIEEKTRPKSQPSATNRKKEEKDIDKFDEEKKETAVTQQIEIKGDMHGVIAGRDVRAEKIEIRDERGKSEISQKMGDVKAEKSKVIQVAGDYVDKRKEQGSKVTIIYNVKGDFYQIQGDKGIISSRREIRKEDVEEVQSELGSPVFDRRCWIVIPRKDGSGNPVPAYKFKEYEEELREHFKGFSVFEDTTGQYVEEVEGVTEVFYDKNRVFMVCFSKTELNKHEKFLREFTERVRDELGQRGVMITCEDAKTYIIGKGKGRIQSLLSRFIAHPYQLQSNFTGRIEERKKLTDWFCNSQCPVVSLTAIGGMGKSALSWVWLNLDVLCTTTPGVELDTPEVKKVCNISDEGKPVDIFQWSFYLGELSFSQFLVDACRYTGGEPEPAKGEEKITDNDRMRTLASRFQDHRYLFILDGFERLLQAYASQDAPLLKEKDAEEYSAEERRCSDLLVARFLESISAGGKSKFLITSRLVPKELEGKPGFLNVDLTGMNDVDAICFLNSNRIIGSDREKKMIANQYENHPLSLTHLVNVLKKDPDRPNDISQAPSYDVSTKVRGRREHILSQSYRILPEEWKRFLTRISAVRGSISYDFIKLVNGDVDIKELEKEVLPNLEEMRWLFWDKKKKLVNFHPLVRRFCYLKLEERGEKVGVHSQLRDYFASVPEPEKIESIDDLQPVIELYHHTVGAGRYDEACDLAYERLIPNPLYFQFGAYQTAIELLRALFPEGEDKPPRLSKESDVAWILNALANDYSLSGQPRRAVPLFLLGNEPDIAAIRKVFPKFDWEDIATYPRGEDARKVSAGLEGLAIGLGNLANRFRDLGDLGSAESNLRREFELYKELKSGDKDLGENRNEYGKLMIYLGRFVDSNTILREAFNHMENAQATQSMSVNWAYRSLRALLMAQDPEAEPEWAKEFASATGEERRGLSSDFPQGLLEKGLRCANKALEFAKKDAEETYYTPRDFIRARWLIGASYVAMKNVDKAEAPLQFTITECRKINLVESEADILLTVAKLRFLQNRKEESLKLATEALEIANRCGYILQQTDIHNFLAEYWLAQGDEKKACEEAEKALECSTQKIDVETGEPVVKDNPKYYYVPAHKKAKAFLDAHCSDAAISDPEGGR